MMSKRYLAKAPIHQLYLDTLVEMFPDATLIYTYRPLTDVLRSHFSLVTTIFKPLGVDTEEFSDRLDFSIITLSNLYTQIDWVR